jgi:hypothetical protein
VTKVSIANNIESKDDLAKLYDFNSLLEPILISSSGFSSSDPLLTDPLILKWLSEILVGKEIYLILPHKNSLFTFLFDSNLKATSFDDVAIIDLSRMVIDLSDDWENASYTEIALLQNKVVDHSFETQLITTFSSKLWRMRNGTFISLAKLAPFNNSLANSLNLFPSKETKIEALNSLIFESIFLVNTIFAKSLAIREGVNVLAYLAENGEYEHDEGKYNTRDSRGLIVIGESSLDVDAISERLMGQDPENSSLLTFIREKLGSWDEMNLRRAKMLSLTII